MNTALPDHHHATLKLPRLELDKAAERDVIDDFSRARIARLESLLQKSRIDFAMLGQLHQKLESVHVQLLKENAQLTKKQRDEALSFRESATEIISLRRQVSALSDQRIEIDRANKLWQLKYEQQQHALDNHARCIDELQTELRRVTLNKAQPQIFRVKQSA